MLSGTDYNPLVLPSFAPLCSLPLARSLSLQIYRPKSFLGPKEERVDALPDGLFSWIVPFFKRPTKAIIDSNGLDAYMFVSYLEMMIWILGPIFIFTWVLLLPIYAVNTPGGESGFNLLTFGQLAQGNAIQSRKYVAPLIVQYIVTGWICFVIRKWMLNFIKLRQDFLVSPHHANHPQARTLLVTGVPNEYLGEQKLRGLYSHLPGGVERVWLNRDLKDLPDVYDERQKLLNKLESVESKIIATAYKKVKKNKVAEGGVEADDPVDRYLTKKERPTMKAGAKLGFFGGKKVDAVTHLRSEIERLTQEINARRGEEKDYKPANAAFLLFKTQVGCHMAMGMVPHHEPYKMSRRYIEAHPNAVVWSNLSMNPYAQKIRTALFWALTIVFILVWLPLIAFTAIVSNLSGLCTEVSWLAWICTIPTAVTGIIQGFLPTVLLAVLNMLLPIILRIFARQSGLPTTTDIELSLMDRMTWFNLIDNFLLFTIISGVSGGISMIVPILENPTGLPALISLYIPKANTFYISYIILQALSGTAGGLLQIAKLVIYYIKTMFLGSTPRKVWHINNDLTSPAWGTLFASTTLTTIITFGYAVLAPLINGFAFVAFIFFWVLYKYLATYVWDMKPENETSGLFFVKAVRASLYGLYVSQLILTVLFFTAQATNANGTTSQTAIPEGVFMVILMVITVGFQIILFDSVGDLTTALPLSLVAPATGNSSNFDGETVNGHRQSSSGEKQRLLAANALGPNGQNRQNVQPGYEESGSYQMKPFQNGQQTGAQDGGQYTGSTNMAKVNSASSGEDEDSSAQHFVHPAMRDPQRTLWYPQDRFGLSGEAVARAREHGLDATDKGTSFNEKNKIQTDMYCPPGEELL